MNIRSAFKKILSIKKNVNQEIMFTKFLVEPKYKDCIGDYTYGKIDIFEWSKGSKLTIGRFCSIADGTRIILGGEHRTDWITTYPFPEIFKTWKNSRKIKGHPSTKGDIQIGNDVWIGLNVTILSGVNIGNGAVIGAGSIVTKNIEPYAIYAGVPARKIRYRFSISKIKHLQKIAWWDWPESKIRRNVKTLCSPRIEDFIEQNRSKSY